MRLLLAGPTPDTTTSFMRALDAAGIAAIRCRFDEALAAVRYDAIDMVLLDPLAEDGEGWRVTKAIRRTRLDAGILLLADAEPLVDDVVLWLSQVDSVLLGLLDPREIVGHLTAIDRRRHGHASARLEVRDLVVDLRSREASYRDQPLPLSKTQLALLMCLMKRAGSCLSKERLVLQIYGDEEPPETKILDVMICKIRQMLRHAGAPADLIETVHGEGYRISRTAHLRAEAA